jgi:hypothetical protein
MEFTKHIPGTAARREALQRQEALKEQQRQAEVEAWQAAQKQAWIDKNPEYYEQEKAALERVKAYQAKLLDPKEVATQQLSVCLVEDERRPGCTFFVVGNKYPYNRTAVGIEPCGSDVIPLARLYEPNGDLREIPDWIVRDAIFGYHLSATWESLLKRKAKLPLDFSDVAQELETHFGPLE